MGLTKVSEGIKSLFEENRASISVGVNSVSKAISEGRVNLVLTASDIDPLFLINHLFPLCQKSGSVLINNIFTLEDLGELGGISRPSSCVGIFVSPLV